MIPQGESVTISAKTLDQWRKDVEKLEEEIRQATEKLSRLKRKIEAVPLFFEGGDELDLSDSPQVEKVSPGSDGSTLMAMRPSQFILYLVRSEAGGIRKGELRRRVESSGYPLEKFGKQFSYFYTLVGRLEGSGKIIREGKKLKAT